MARTGARTARVTRVAVDGRVYVELAEVAPGFEFGPVLDTVGDLEVGERVVVTCLARDEDELVVIGALDRPPAGEHTHHASAIVDGVLDLARLPVAPSGNSNPTQIPRADDARLSDARTPTAHTHDDRYYTETETDALLAGKANTPTITYVSQSSDHTLTDAVVALPGLTVTTNTPAGATTLVHTDLDIDSVSAFVSVSLYVDGAAWGAGLLLNGSTGGRYPAAKTWIVTGLSAASHTFTIRANKSGAAGTIIRSGHSTMSVEVRA